MIQILSVLFTLTFAIYLTQLYWKRKRFYDLVAKVPGYGSSIIHRIYFFIMSVYIIFTLPRKRYFQKLMSYYKDDAPMTGFWVAGRFTIITKNAEIINKLFNSHQTYNKPEYIYNTFQVTKGLLQLNGDDHKRHRKILDRAFKTNMLQRLPQIFDEKSKKILSKLNEKVDSKKFDLLEYVGAYILETFTGSHLNYETEIFKSDIHNMHSQVLSQMLSKIFPYIFLGISGKMFSVLPFARKMKEMQTTFRSFVKNVIEWNCMNKRSDDETLINLLLDPKNGFDKKEIRHEVNMFSMAAYDTTSKTLTIALMLIGMYPDVQNQLMQEIYSILNQTQNFPNNLEFLNKFVYLNAVLKETMRLFPAGTMIARETSEDINLDGIIVPKGVMFWVCIYGLHRNEKYWGKDAHLFKPERFLNELENPRAYLPFAGQRYAMISMKIFIINFLRKFKVSSSTKFEDLDIEFELTLNVMNGYEVSIQKRTGQSM